MEQKDPELCEIEVVDEELPLQPEKRSMNLKAKVVVIIAVLYVLSPIDLIPDFIPIAGWIDDVIAIIIATFTVIEERD